jgi:L-asparaginase
VLGYTQDNRAHFHRASTRLNTADTEFDVSDLDKLPQVDIVYAYSNAYRH